MAMKLNERSWQGDLISWIKESIIKDNLVFQEATMDSGIDCGGITKFPDILLFLDKISGVIFNGWELKLPDTPVDDKEMLKNALEKAKKIGANSFVTWNCRDTIIWGIGKDYSLDHLFILKKYTPIKEINIREDISIYPNYIKNEPFLKQRLKDLLVDLQDFYNNGKIKESINISESFLRIIQDTQEKIVPLFESELRKYKGKDKAFREDFNAWEILESSTLNALENSSSERFFSKLIYYKLIARVILYLSLSENINGLPPIQPKNLISKDYLKSYFDEARKIDYQAVFTEDFGDKVEFNSSIEKNIACLIASFQNFKFKVLPTGVIGNIMENLVPPEEKQRFGQYFTPQILADLVSFPVIDNKESVLLDPASGTGTFLNSFYGILQYFGENRHQELLKNIWGNEISQFPATLSVISLYKQNIQEANNFPRVIKGDLFNLESNKKIQLPDPVKTGNFKSVEIPKFDGIASNFPFIEQEKIPKDKLNTILKKELGKNFIEVEGRSDFYIYCFYHSLNLLNKDGKLSAITSNSWLGKNYSKSFKKFLVNNFHIKYLIKSEAEHWFKDSEVSTIFIVLQKGEFDYPTRFVTIKSKLDKLFNETNKEKYYKSIEKFYNQIDNCDHPSNEGWINNEIFPNLFSNKKLGLSVSVIEKNQLIKSIEEEINWDSFFEPTQNLFDTFKSKLISPKEDNLIESFRGFRTGYDKLHLMSSEYIKSNKINKRFLYPIIKNSKEIKSINIPNDHQGYFLFSPDITEIELKKNFPNESNFVNNIGLEETTISSKKTTIREKFAVQEKRGFEKWYMIPTKDMKRANLMIPINLGERIFFSYSSKGVIPNQRMTGITVKKEGDKEILAALFNSIITLLSVEIMGTSRYGGTLDLNADFVDSNKFKILNPSLLKLNQKKQIIGAFKKIKDTEVLPEIDKEFSRPERKEFDKIIFKAYGFDEKILPSMYSLLINKVKTRINMKLL